MTITGFFLVIYFPVISYNSRPVTDESVLARMCESKQIMLLGALLSFVAFYVYFNTFRQQWRIWTNALSNYWQGPLGLKRHFALFINNR
jgi:hypothetical protein